MRSNKFSPTRRAILIGCPGGGDTDFLSGVKLDLENVSVFLKSPGGGVWSEKEIRKLYNASLYEVQKAINDSIADYVFVYFSGHGSTNSNTQGQMLYLKDRIVPDRILLNASPRQLIIVDACRDEAPPAISGIPGLLQEFDNFTGSPARRLFDDFIRNSPAGKIIVYGTNKGTSSLDSVMGGLFTNALLETAGSIVMEKQYTPIQIGSLLGPVQQMLRKQRNHQVPSAVNLTGRLTVPFAIGIPQSEIPDMRPAVSRNSEKIEPAGSNAGWLLLGLGVVILALATSKSKR